MDGMTEHLVGKLELSSPMCEVPTRYKEGLPKRYISIPTQSTIFVILKRVELLANLRNRKCWLIGTSKSRCAMVCA